MTILTKNLYNKIQKMTITITVQQSKQHLKMTGNSNVKILPEATKRNMQGTTMNMRYRNIQNK